MLSISTADLEHSTLWRFPSCSTSRDGTIIAAEGALRPSVLSLSHLSLTLCDTVMHCFAVHSDKIRGIPNRGLGLIRQGTVGAWQSIVSHRTAAADPEQHQSDDTSKKGQSTQKFGSRKAAFDMQDDGGDASAHLTVPRAVSRDAPKHPDFDRARMFPL